jgi:hypothetical protein
MANPNGTSLTQKGICWSLSVTMQAWYRGNAGMHSKRAAENGKHTYNMLSALAVTFPDLDGWASGEATNALILIST